MGGGPDQPLHSGMTPSVEAGDAVDEATSHAEDHGRKSYLQALVDMGSNGIRFSISDLSPGTTRVLPTVYMSRTGISLYDAQFDPDTGERIPISQSVIKAVITALNRFKIVCSDFGVSKGDVRILATEATRTALNSIEFRKAIKDSTGWEVKMLTPSEEGIVGAYGIASSFSKVKGLVMDLGGGSAQITWMIAENGTVQTCPGGAISFPYGAAALTRRLAEAEKGKSEEEAEKAIAELRKEVVSNFQKAYRTLLIPDELVAAAKTDSGFSFYLSGGGFRGWGYLLLSQSQKHHGNYPISIINGFWAHKQDFEDTEKLKEVARNAQKLFRVSDRRRKQVPAVAFLVNALSLAIPHGVKDARFCQGGVREGILYRELPQHIRAQNPLTVVTAPYASPSARQIDQLLVNAIPKKTSSRSTPQSIGMPLLQAFSNMLYTHADRSKESASISALYSTTTGALASAHGVSHADRAILAIMLDERFEGEVPPLDAHFKDHLAQLLTPEEIWWCRYIGTVAWMIGEIYPAGTIDGKKPRVTFATEWTETSKDSKYGLELTISLLEHGQAMTDDDLVANYVKAIQKVGKKKNWIGGEEGWGMSIKVKVVRA